MPKDASYHEAAIRYNEEIAAFAEDLSERLEHEEVARWSKAVGKQHRFHGGRHKRALNKIRQSEMEDSPSPDPGPVAEDVSDGKQESEA